MSKLSDIKRQLLKGDYTNQLWYITKQNCCFRDLAMMARILEMWNDDSSEPFASYFDRIKTTKPFSEFLSGTPHRALKNCEFYGLMRPSISPRAAYSSVNLTPVYFNIKDLCGGDFQQTNKYQAIINNQLEHMSIMVDNKEINPVMYTLKVLLTLGDVTGDYSIQNNEFKLFVCTSNEWSQFFQSVESTIRSREDANYLKDCSERFDIANDTRFNLVFDNLSYIERTKDGFKIKPEYVETVRKKVAEYELGTQVDDSESHQLKDIRSKNIIYYGAPGTGKSFNIDKKLKDDSIPDEHVKRVIFYPDYTYSDFIGGLSPVTNKEGKPEYRFVAGPFTEILKEAFDDLDSSYYMIIEEINRGNPAAIFGDVFQLLDRGATGKSKYTITNGDVASYLRDGDVTKFNNDRIWLPGNLYIICTMNTADQNVFVLDTAFKRRFAMEYVPIDFNKLNDKDANDYNKETDVFDGKRDVKDIFKNTDLAEFVSANAAVMKRNWPTFAQLVNEKINIINKSGDSISEDKKLGPFFVSLDEINDRQKFADKVLYYLKQDVFKYTDTVLVPSYQKLYFDFVVCKADLFELFANVE